MNDRSAEPTYQSFLLRCWQSNNDPQAEGSTWYFALRSVSAESHEHAFSDLKQLMAFISAELHRETTIGLETQ